MQKFPFFSSLLLPIFPLLGFFLAVGRLAPDEVAVLVDQFLYLAIDVLIFWGELDVFLEMLVVEGLVVLSTVLPMMGST